MQDENLTIHDEEDLFYELDHMGDNFTLDKLYHSSSRNERDGQRLYPDPGDARERIMRLLQCAKWAETEAEMHTFLRMAKQLEAKGEHEGHIFFPVVETAAMEVALLYELKRQAELDPEPEITKVITLPPELMMEMVNVEPQLEDIVPVHETELIMDITDTPVEVEAILVDEPEDIVTNMETREIELSDDLVAMLDDTMNQSPEVVREPDVPSRIVTAHEPVGMYGFQNYLDIEEITDVKRTIRTYHLVLMLLAGAIIGVTGWNYFDVLAYKAVLIFKVLFGIGA